MLAVICTDPLYVYGLFWLFKVFLFHAFVVLGFTWSLSGILTNMVGLEFVRIPVSCFSERSPYKNLEHLVMTPPKVHGQCRV